MAPRGLILPQQLRDRTEAGGEPGRCLGPRGPNPTSTFALKLGGERTFGGHGTKELDS